MGTFIVDGTDALPAVKSNSRPATIPPSSSEWTATDANQIRQALLDLRSGLIAYAYSDAEETAAFGAGAKVVIRLDLIGVPASAFVRYLTESATVADALGFSVDGVYLILNGDFDPAPTEEGTPWTYTSQTFTSFLDPGAGASRSRESSPAWLTGPTYAMKLSTVSSPGLGVSASLGYRIPVADFSVNEVIRFDHGISDAAGYASTMKTQLLVRAYDSGDVQITGQTNYEHCISMFGSFGGSANETLAYHSLPAANTKYSESFNLKTFVESILDGGKSWSDVSYVNITWYHYSDNSSVATDYYVNNVR
jgi:hypothetical protein